MKQLGPEYVEHRRRILDFARNRTSYPRDAIAATTRDIFRDFRTKTLTSVECVMLLDMLSFGLSFTKMGRGIFCRQASAPGGVFGLGNSAELFREQAALLVLTLGRYVFEGGKDRVDADALASSYAAYRAYAGVAEEQYKDGDAFISGLREVLDKVAGAMFYDPTRGRVEFENGNLSLFYPFKAARFAFNGLLYDEDEARIRAYELSKANVDPVALDSRAMSLILDFFKDDSGADGSEKMAHLFVYGKTVGTLDEKVLNEVYGKYEAYCEEQMGKMSEAVMATGIDIGDYGVRLDI